MIIGSNWEFLPILYLDVLRLNWTVDFPENSDIIIIVKGTEQPKKINDRLGVSCGVY